MTVDIARATAASMSKDPVNVTRVLALPVALILLSTWSGPKDVLTESHLLLLRSAILAIGLTLLAVGWHRHILDCATRVPPGRAFLRYCCLAAPISILLFRLPQVLTNSSIEHFERTQALIDFDSSGGAVIVALVGTGMMMVAEYIAFRIYPLLPAAAIGERMTLRTAWSATRAIRGVCVTLVVIHTLWSNGLWYVFHATGGWELSPLTFTIKRIAEPLIGVAAISQLYIATRVRTH